MSTLSAAPVSPAAPVRGRSRPRRPSTLTVYRWELFKLIHQKRTYLGLALVVILPLFFVIFQSVHTRHDHGTDSIFAAQITQSGLATPVLMLLFLSMFMLPLVASLVAGDIVANEDGNGTLKTILTRSVDRGQVIAGKAIAAITYAAVAVLLSSATSTVAGVASWGFRPLRTLSGSVVPASEALLLVFASSALYLIPLAALVAIGVLLSAATRNSAAAVVATIGLVLALYILAAIPGLEAIKPYLLTEQLQAWQGLLRTPTDWSPVAHSAWVSALYGLPSLFAAYLVFLRRDVAGG